MPINQQQHDRSPYFVRLIYQFLNSIQSTSRHPGSDAAFAQLSGDFTKSFRESLGEDLANKVLLYFTYTVEICISEIRSNLSADQFTQVENYMLGTILKTPAVMAASVEHLLHYFAPQQLGQFLTNFFAKPGNATALLDKFTGHCDTLVAFLAQTLTDDTTEPAQNLKKLLCDSLLYPLLTEAKYVLTLERRTQATEILFTALRPPLIVPVAAPQASEAAVPRIKPLRERDSFAALRSLGAVLSANAKSEPLTEFAIGCKQYIAFVHEAFGADLAQCSQQGSVSFDSVAVYLDQQDLQQQLRLRLPVLSAMDAYY